MIAHPYVLHPSGLWQQPGASQKGARPLVPYTTAERTACEELARALRALAPGGTRLDIMPDTPALSEALGALIASSPERIDGEHALITAVHSFQRLSREQAADCLRRMRKAIAPSGRVFLRVPDREVVGFERDLTPAHYATAACFWSLPAMLDLLLETETFSVERTYEVAPGQRDYVLRPIDKLPSVCAGIIAKNEERDLPRCLKSLEGAVDALCLVDTGSVDATIKIAQDWASGLRARAHISQYLGASRQDARGDWKLWDFAKARNEFVQRIDSEGYDYALWMDADDELLNGRQMRALTLLDQYDIQAVVISSGGLRWPHHRLWRTGRGIRFAGRCHEYPQWSGPDCVHQHVEIRHDAAPPTAGENSNERNLRILEREFAEAPTARCAFYLGNTHKDGGRWAEAVSAYRARLAYGKGYADEYYFAALYLSRCLRMSGRNEEAIAELLRFASERPDWAEFWMELCYAEMALGRWAAAAEHAHRASKLQPPKTALFRELNMYSDQPLRMLSFCHERLNNLSLALRFARAAQAAIGRPDTPWDLRILELEAAQ